MMASEMVLSEAIQLSQDDERDFGQFSDHVTVWIDQHIGVDNSYKDFRGKFDKNIQVLQSNNATEAEIDDDSMAYADPDLLRKLSDDMYCLKYFSTPEKGLQYIRNNPHKRIFFISSGTIGKEVVPQLVDLYQVHGIYIFCGNISAHVEWAMDYDERITAMLEHHDDLLQRLTRDIAEYLEKKGDVYQQQFQYLKARNCYAWAKKLLVRGKELGDRSSGRLIDRVTDKFNESQSTTACEPRNPTSDVLTNFDDIL